MKKIIGLTSVLLLASILMYGQKRKKNEIVPRYTPKFDYSPSTREQVAKNHIVILLMRPVFIDRDINVAGSPWSDFSTSMGNDLEELLTAKGFIIRGDVFNNYDDLVYSDKANADLIITAEIDFHANDDRQLKSLFVISENKHFKVASGNVGITSTVILSAISPVTKQKLWKKNLSLPVRNFSYSGSATFIGNNPPSVLEEMKEDPNLWNPVCKALEDIYQESMNTIWKQFDPSEIKAIAIESKKADGKIK